MGTFDDNRRTQPTARRFRRIAFTLDPPDGDLGLRRRARALPVRARRPRRGSSPGLLRGLQHPGRRACSSGSRAIGGAEGRDRRLGRAGLHARADRRREGDGPRGPAAQRHPRLHAARLRHRGRHEGQRASRSCARSASPAEELDITAGRPADARGDRPPVRRAASRSTTSRSRTSRPACAPTTCSGSPTSAAASCSAPATSPSSRSAGRPTASATR